MGVEGGGIMVESLGVLTARFPWFLGLNAAIGVPPELEPLISLPAPSPPAPPGAPWPVALRLGPGLEGIPLGT